MGLYMCFTQLSGMASAPLALQGAEFKSPPALPSTVHQLPPQFPEPTRRLMDLNATRKTSPLLFLEDNVIKAMYIIFSSTQALMLRHLEESVTLLKNQVLSGAQSIYLNSSLFLTRLILCHRLTLVSLNEAFHNFFKAVTSGSEASMGCIIKYADPVSVASGGDLTPLDEDRSRLWARQTAEMSRTLAAHAHSFEFLAQTHTWTHPKCTVYFKVLPEMFYHHDEAVATMHTPPGEQVLFWRSVVVRSNNVGDATYIRPTPVRSPSI
eukprot:TRINITY_DN2792_c0_g1_i1.p1 TRINITY_DN2792_c0_g1~~TRINITY_DN2792_c0_g1_i1.p1  ORF type:complete len:284 (-),score=35.55 TRINITY_DN2792_c0_g1_i1:274-1071(-)